MSIVYLGLGSNLNAPRRQLAYALKQVRAFPRSCVQACSRMYLTKPVGVRAQPNYLNMVVTLKTRLSPDTLLSFCKNVEQKQSRIRKKRWGSRTIDIDILLYDQKVIQKNDLILPHPQLKFRDFVIVPLLELSPNQCLPNGEPIRLGEESIQTIVGVKL